MSAGFDVAKMGYRPGYYAIALKQEARRKLMKTLVCSQCGKQNKPGAQSIDIDDHDTAWCDGCGYNWAVRVE